MFTVKSSRAGSKFVPAGIAFALALTLTACGGDEVAQVDDQSLVTEVEEAPQASGGFDADDLWQRWRAWGHHPLPPPHTKSHTPD